MMRFQLTFTTDDNSAPTPEKLAAIAKFTEETAKAGILLDSGAILPSSKGARVRLAGGKFTVTDGPFPETKELIVGYAIIQVRSKEEAIEQARRFMKVAGDGLLELRQMVGSADGPHH